MYLKGLNIYKMNNNNLTFIKHYFSAAISMFPESKVICKFLLYVVCFFYICDIFFGEGIYLLYM